MKIDELRKLIDTDGNEFVYDVFGQCAEEFFDLFEMCNKHALKLPIQVYSKLNFLREALNLAGIES